MGVRIELQGEEFVIPTNGNNNWGTALTAYLRALAVAADGVEADIAAALALPVLTAASFANSWVNYDAAAFNAAGYYRDAFGLIHLQGLVKDGTVSTDFALGRIFTLGTGNRPAREQVYSCAAFDGADFIQCSVRVIPDGRVVAYAGMTGGTGKWISLDGLSFRT